MIGCRDVFFSARFASFHTHASLLTVFVCFLVLIHSCCSECLGKHTCMSSPFHTAILNGTVPSSFAKRHDRNDRRFACQKLTIIIIIIIIQILQKNNKNAENVYLYKIVYEVYVIGDGIKRVLLSS